MFPLNYCFLLTHSTTIIDIRLDLVLNVRKRDISPTALHAIALETINTRFPPEEWLHIYTDGSLLDFAKGAGIGVFSHLFSFYLHAGPLTTHFDGEVEAIHIALQQLAVHLPPIERAVILSDSTSSLQALSNYNENDCLPSRVARDKPWITLCKKSHGIPSSPRAAVVAKFRLLTGHDCLCAHLFRFNLVTSPICVLCDTGQDMTAAHLDECSALNDLNCIRASACIATCGDGAMRIPTSVTNLHGTFPLIFLGVFLGKIDSRLFPINFKKMYGIFKLDKDGISYLLLSFGQLKGIVTVVDAGIAVKCCPIQAQLEKDLLEIRRHSLVHVGLQQRYDSALFPVGKRPLG
ncbi:uncharacterized protein LOC103524116 [Trichonephila clavipes]|nr:uncharacterized protein LOC103524116 [Trichonephila clavipes]